MAVRVENSFEIKICLGLHRNEREIVSTFAKLPRWTTSWSKSRGEQILATQRAKKKKVKESICMSFLDLQITFYTEHDKNNRE